ncbi:PadR family transcriptional regulator [Streptomyces sp. 3MP-14]|uniref:PadR family transcriptional regulator n=1 Tax=Streptomyces mimosae TaxID=2586635 RepID=A0A5N5ZPC7_9ACTN|nr:MULTISPECIES: PadR family transcriptional regulator [Streptomyces]KAB8158354.1 PadR family transcriptional regulator [Streptomyces mimosae]KAB8172547.1 PadR family transcriptional regulator [Streptomyces sp. 3MP-14]
MSIRFGLLALLDQGPRYGSQLRAEFESRTGTTWPLNIGQVYTTLGRLERDGLIRPEGGGDAKQQLYAITEEGRRSLVEWFDSPVDRTQPSRDELAIKLAMAVGTPGVNLGEVIQRQRRHTLAAMRDYTRLKADAMNAGSSDADPTSDDVAWLLVLEQLIFYAEAEVRWLDHCEARLVRLAARRAERGERGERAGGPPAAEEPAAESPTRTVARKGASS